MCKQMPDENTKYVIPSKKFGILSVAMVPLLYKKEH
jgi:hypothetical protein